MDRDEILKSAQENKERGREFEREEIMRGDDIASYVGMLVGIALILAKLFVLRQFDYGVCAVVFTTCCVEGINEGIRLKKWWMTAGGIFAGLIALLMAIGYIGGLYTA